MKKKDHRIKTLFKKEREKEKKKHFSSEEKLINSLSHKTPQRDILNSHPTITCISFKPTVEKGQSCAYPARPGGTLVSLSFLEFIQIPASIKKRNKQLSLSILISFPITPTTSNNQLAFQLLLWVFFVFCFVLFCFSASEHQSRFPEEPEAKSPRGELT